MSSSDPCSNMDVTEVILRGFKRISSNAIVVHGYMPLILALGRQVDHLCMFEARLV